jgi:hypothetical protein
MKKVAVGTAILAGVGIFGYAIYKYFSKQINLLKEFEWKVLDFTIDTIDLQTLSGKIKFRFSSISDIQLTISKFYLDFYVNGERIGYLEDVTKFIIPAKGYSDIPFEYTINPQFFIKNIVDIIAYTTKQKDAIVTFVGYAQISSGFVKATVPISTNCSIKNLECKV